MTINAVNDLRHYPNIPLSADSVDILQRLKKVNSGYFFRPNATLVNKLKAINPVELTKVLNCFFMQALQEKTIADPVKFLDRLAKVMPFAKMQEAVKPDVVDALKEAQDMFEEAKHAIQMTKANAPPGVRAADGAGPCVAGCVDLLRGLDARRGGHGGRSRMGGAALVAAPLGHAAA